MSADPLRNLAHFLAGPATDTLLLTLLLGALLALAVALGLLIAPQRLHAVGRRLDRWYSTHRALRPLDQPRYWERAFYRHARAFGSAIAAASAGVLAWLVFGYDRAATLAALDGTGPLTDWWLDALIATLTVGNALALLFAAVLLRRPSTLKGFEKVANRWLSTQRALRVLDLPHGQADRLVYRHPRLIGALLLLGSLYLLFNLAPWLLLRF